MVPDAARSTLPMELLADAPDDVLLRTRDFAALARKYYGPVFGLARRLLRDPADARDAAQETFVRALAHLSEFQPGRSFRTWLFAITAHHVRDLLRRRRQRPLDTATEEALPELSLPDERLLREENRERLLAALDRLPFDLKVVVALHFQQDLAHPETAQVLGISVNAVRIRLYRALAALRKELA
jgi:RNA polymerase sigma-70 factor (ECF subfamily)